MKQIMFKQISDYFEPSYENFSVVFAQYCLLAGLEKWKSIVDNKRNFGALLTDLSKAFGMPPP